MLPKIQTKSLKKAVFDKDQKAPVIRLLNRVMIQTGFFYLSDPGISPQLISSIQKELHRFFAMDNSYKQQIRMEKYGRQWRGFFSLGHELTAGVPDQKEGLYLGPEFPSTHPEVKKRTPTFGDNPWPRSGEFDKLRVMIREYVGELQALGDTLIDAISMSLNLPPRYLRDHYASPPTILLRAFHYPPARPGFGVAKHTDMGFITLLHQDENGGLEVLNREGNWTNVKPITNTFIINIGDMLEYVSHGLLRATPHRVTNKSQNSRLSIPFFYDPNWYCRLQPVPKELLPIGQITSFTEKRWDGINLHSPSWQGKTYGEFVWEKIKTVFPSLSKEP